MSDLASGSPKSLLSAPVPRAPARARRRALRGFYLGLTTLMVATVVVGFWPSYFGKLASGTPPQLPTVVHLHGLVFIGWMLLLVLQVSLAARGRIALHRAVGRVGIAYGILVCVMGLVVGFAATARHVRAGEWSREQAAGFLIFPPFDMLLFGCLFGAAVWHRKRPETHKRLMVLATLALVFAAAARINQPSLLVWFGVWITPLAIALAHDWWTLGRIHRVYAIGTPVLLLSFARAFAEKSAWWAPIGRRMLDLVVPPG